MTVITLQTDTLCAKCKQLIKAETSVEIDEALVITHIICPIVFPVLPVEYRWLVTKYLSAAYDTIGTRSYYSVTINHTVTNTVIAAHDESTVADIQQIVNTLFKGFVQDEKILGYH